MPELPDARLQEFLALLCHVILGVLTQIPHSNRFFEFFRDIVRQLVLQNGELVLELLLDVLGHVLEHYNPRRV